MSILVLPSHRRFVELDFQTASFDGTIEMTTYLSSFNDLPRHLVQIISILQCFFFFVYVSYLIRNLVSPLKTFYSFVDLV